MPEPQPITWSPIQHQPTIKMMLMVGGERAGQRSIYRDLAGRMYLLDQNGQWWEEDGPVK
jgi:hypothetical protein